MNARESLTWVDDTADEAGEGIGPVAMMLGLDPDDLRDAAHAWAQKQFDRQGNVINPDGLRAMGVCVMAGFLAGIAFTISNPKGPPDA